MANRTIFVGDLSCFVTEQHLMQLFSPCGPISSVEIKRSASGDSLMHGFVKFLQDDAAILATRCFHDKKFMGRRMVVNPTTSRAPKKPYDQWHKLTLHFTSRRSDNLDITEEVLDLLCSGFGEIGDTVVRNHAPADAMAVVQQGGRKAFGPITGKEIIGYAVVFFVEATSAQRAFEALHHQTIDQITFQCSISAHTAVSVLSHQLNPQNHLYTTHHINNTNMNLNNMGMHIDMCQNNMHMNNNANLYLKEEIMDNNNLGFSSSFYHPNNHNMNNVRNNAAVFALPAPPQNTSPRQMQPPYVSSSAMDKTLSHSGVHPNWSTSNNNYNIHNNNANNGLHPLLMSSSSSSSSTLSLPYTKSSNSAMNNTAQTSQYPNSWANNNTANNGFIGTSATASNNMSNLNMVHNTSSLSLPSLMSPTSSFYVSPSLTSQPSFFFTSSTNSCNTNNNATNTTMSTTTNSSLKTVAAAVNGPQEDDMYFANLAHFHSSKTH